MKICLTVEACICIRTDKIKVESPKKNIKELFEIFRSNGIYFGYILENEQILIYVLLETERINKNKYKIRMIKWEKNQYMNRTE